MPNQDTVGGSAQWADLAALRDKVLGTDGKVRMGQSSPLPQVGPYRSTWANRGIRRNQPQGAYQRTYGMGAAMCPSCLKSGNVVYSSQEYPFCLEHADRRMVAESVAKLLQSDMVDHFAQKRAERATARANRTIAAKPAVADILAELDKLVMSTQKGR